MICPYYKNRDVFDGFNEIIITLGGRPMTEEEFRSPELRDLRSGRDYSAMEAAYRIYNRNGGNLLDRTPQGNPSILFQTLLDHFNGDRRKAIIAKSNVYSNEFFNWFGDWTAEDKENVSKVVDENGEPLVVWHGSHEDFSEFDVRKTRYFPYVVEDYKGEITGVNDIYSAFFFSSNKQYSERYSGGTVDVDLSDEEYELRFSALNEREKMLRKRRVTLRKLFNSTYGDPLTKNGFSGFEENIPLNILDEFDKWVKEGDSEEVKDKIKKYNKIDAELEARIDYLDREKRKRTIKKAASNVLYPVYLNIKRDITNEVSELPFVFAFQLSSRDFFNESDKISDTNFIEIDSMLAATARYFLSEKTFRDNVGLIGRDRGSVYVDPEEDNLLETHTGFEYAVFDPNQIKHVENLGTWSQEDANIYHITVGDNVQQDDISSFEQTSFVDSFGQDLAAKLLNGETVSSRELMSAMIANHIFSTGDTKLAELLSLHDVPVRVANNMGVGELAETITDNGGSVILINPNEVYNISRGYFGTAVMHEIIHSVTVDIIDNPRTSEEKEFVRQNRNTYEHINSYFRQNGAIKLDVLGGMHVLDNEKEFAAYFASDPTVRAAIIEMAESLDRTYKRGLLKRIVRLINKFIPAFIKRAVGIKQTAVEQVKLYEKTLTDFLYNRPLIEKGNIPSKSYLKAVYAKENGAITNHENFIDSMKLLERMNKAQKNFVKLGTERYNITIGGNKKRVQITSWDEVKLALSTRVSALLASNMDSVVKSRLLSITQNLLEMFVIDEAGKYLAIQNLLDTAIPLIIEDIDNLKKIRRTNGKFTNDDAMYHMHANLGMYHEVFDTIKKMISDDHNRQEMVDLFNASAKEEKDKISIEDINEIERHLDNATAYTKEGMSVVEYMIKENVINKLSDIGNQVGNPEMGDYLNALNSEMSSDLIDDIGMFESWAAPADASTNEAVRTIAYLINKAMNIATMSTAGKATDLLRLKENLKKGEHEWDIYERDENGNFTGYLVRDLNFGRFYRDYQKEIRDINSKIRDIFNIPDLDLDRRIAPEINKTAIIDGVETTPKLYFERRKEKWLSTHAERRYTPEYYKLYAELPQSVKDSLSEIRVLINSITLNYKNLYDENGHPHYEQLSDDDWVKINVLWERRRQLRSDYDEYGNKKHGRDLEDARALQKLYDTLYKKNSDGTNKQKVHDKTGWLAARNEIIRKYGKDSLELEKWDERNTRKVLKKNSYGETIVFKKIAEEFGSTPPSYGEEYEQLSEERREYLNNYRLANGEVDVNAMPEVIKNAVRKLDIKLASIRKSRREDEDFRKYVANYNEVKDKYIKYVYTKEFEKIYKQIEEEAERRAAAEDSDDFDAPSADEFMYAMLSGVYGEYVLYSDDIVDEDDFGEFRAYSWLTKIEARDELYMDLEPNDSWLDKEDTNNINKNFDESYDVPWVPKRSIYDNSEQYNKIFGVNGSDTLAALYTGVQETLLESNQMYNRQYADNFLLPLRECSFLGRLRRRPFWNGIMHYIAKTFGFFLGGLNPLQSFILEENPSTVSAGRIIGREEDPNDTEIGQNYQETINGDYQHVGGVYPDGRDFHIIPQYFTKRMKHPEYISRNVVDITASYYKMAQMYHLRSIIRNDCEAILDVLRDLKFKAPDATALTKLIRKIGGSKGQESNTYQFAKRLIERDLYDVLRLPAQFTIAGRTYDISKILGLWKRWTTARNLGLNPKVAIVGFLTTSFTHILNGAVGYKYGGREMWNANKIVLKEFGRSIFSEGTFIGSRLTKNRVMLLMEMMDLSDQSNRKTEHSNRNRWLLAIYKNSTFGLLSAADVSSKSVIMVSTMLAYRYVDGEFMTNALIRESKEAFIQQPAKNKKYSNRYEELKALFKESDVTSYDIFIDGDEKLHVDPLYLEAWDKVKNTIMNRSIKNAELADGMATRLQKAMMTRSFLGAFALIHRQYIPLMLNQTFGKRVYDFDTEEYKNAQFRTMWAYMQRLMATNALAALGGGCFCGVALGGFGLVPLITGSLALAASLAKKYLGSERKSFKKSLRDEEFFNASGSAKARANSLANRYLVKQTILEVLLINCVIAPFANFMSAAADGWDKEDKLTRLILQWIAYFARAFQFESNAKYNWLDLNNNIQTLTAGTAVTEGSVDFLSALGTALANTGANILATGLYGSNTTRSTARDIYEAYDAYQQSEDDEVIQRSKVYKGWTRLLRALFKLLPIHNVVEQTINPEDKRRYQENKVMRMSKRDKRSFFYDLFVDDEKDITIFDIIHYI